MQSDLRIQYMANILHVIYADAQIADSEEVLFNTIAQELGAKRPTLDKAFAYSQADDFALSFPFRYSDALRNLEDMIQIVLADKKSSPEEKNLIHEAKNQLGLSDKQFKRIITEAKNRVS